MMKAIILMFVTTAVWAEDLYDGTRVIFGAGDFSQRSSGQTSQGQRPGEVFTSGLTSDDQRPVFITSHTSQGQQPGQIFTSGKASPGPEQVFSSLPSPIPFSSKLTTLPNNRYCDHARRPLVDEVFQGRAYHFSWCHDGGRSYTWYDAIHHCQGLGNGFQAISIERPDEDSFVAGVLRTYQIGDIWTSGSTLSTYQWFWQTGVSTGYTNWSNTGRLGRSQPDNADGNEQCLAVVNSLGIGWHDSRCNTLRPVICETEAFYRQ
ncbi:uncharacterized protein LOC121854178 [Homarus americanus]|uniref:uncharacterized protein LOC121854178 n=1 Tax=Homarus americanus TaxID=6706 RepID=UPI001C47A259|nr:uncharacterized protein LOC121854178 [Homarus americanus]